MLLLSHEKFVRKLLGPTTSEGPDGELPKLLDEKEDLSKEGGQRPAINEARPGVCELVVLEESAMLRREDRTSTRKASKLCLFCTE
mmetsp:Transcript_5617/g.8739  ORF Transcript_5617/g.8739 Transcript_5617/m.8739 type:complete len:86 (-) Transcript_5617:234-491(-)